MSTGFNYKPDPTLTEGWGIIPRTGPGSGSRRRVAHYYRDGKPVCGVMLPQPYGGPLRTHRDLDSNCERCELVLWPAKRRPPWSTYDDSRLCHWCGRDYLYPAYGSQRGVCNDCEMSGRRKHGIYRATRPGDTAKPVAMSDSRSYRGPRHGT